MPEVSVSTIAATTAVATTKITPDPDAIITEIEIAAPPARVFEALTDAEQLPRWFGSAECPVKFWRMDARLGGKYSYASEKSGVMLNGVTEFKCHSEITEIDPPRLLIYTWFGNWHADAQLKTIVRWDLAPTASGTHVKVTHSGLVTDPASLADYSGGWPGVMESLKQFAETTNQ
jgi:uncharacterized protein YndB with AHSA1/START domain